MTDDHVRDLLAWWDSLGAGSLAPSARLHQVIGYNREAHDDAIVKRDIRREHYQTDDDWLTEPLVNEGIR
jgi:hypothetical protein